ncbi:MAG: hypothetical protein AB7N65_08335 [Vicinamibacterales bacterium]
MSYRTVTTIGALTCALAVTGCTSDADRETRDTTTMTETTPAVDRAAEQRQERENEIAQMEERFAEVQRKYDEKTAERPRGTSGSTAANRLRSDVADDMGDLKQAIADLRTTTAENWWERQEEAMKDAAEDVEADVASMTGRKVPAPAAKTDRTADTAAEPTNTAPFTSRRDRFVSDMQARIESWKTALDKVKARGARETRLEDLKARVNKLDEDVDKLKSASADDWWDVSKARVADYLDRVENSVERLDDNT